MGTLRSALGLGAVTAVAGLGWAVAEAQAFTLRRVTVPVLAPGERAMRVLHLSDLHLTPSQDRKIEWVRGLADLEPDLVVDTGDNMAHLDALPALLYALDPLLSVPGAFVMGSNDYYAPRAKNPARYFLPDARLPGTPSGDALPAPELASTLRDAGWRDLTNRRDGLVVDGRLVSLVGVDDPHLDRDRFPAVGERHDVDLHLGWRTRRTAGCWTPCTRTGRSWCWPGTRTAGSCACRDSGRW